MMEPDEPRTDVETVKLAINNLLWMYAPADTTLGDAEERACVILQIVMRHPKPEMEGGG